MNMSDWSDYIVHPPTPIYIIYYPLFNWSVKHIKVSLGLPDWLAVILSRVERNWEHAHVLFLYWDKDKLYKRDQRDVSMHAREQFLRTTFWGLGFKNKE